MNGDLQDDSRQTLFDELERLVILRFSDPENSPAALSRTRAPLDRNQPIWQISFLTPNAPEEPFDEYEEFAEIRMEDGTYLGSLNRQKNGDTAHIAEVIFAPAPENDILRLEIHAKVDNAPVAPVVLELHAHPPANPTHVRRIFADTAPTARVCNLGVEDFEIGAPEAPPTTKTILSQTRAVDADARTLALGPAVPEHAADPDSPDPLLAIEPRRHDALRRQWPERDNNNPRDTSAEGLMQVHFLENGQKVKPARLDSRAETYASACLGVVLMHFHLRRWLAGHPNMQQIARHSIFSQRTSEVVWASSLFSHLGPVCDIVDDWVARYLAADLDSDDARPDAVDDNTLWHMLKHRLKRIEAEAYDELYDPLIAGGFPGVEAQIAKALPLFMRTRLLADFQWPAPGDDDQALQFERFVLPLATRILRSALARDRAPDEIAFNTQALSPDTFDVVGMYNHNPASAVVHLIDTASWLRHHASRQALSQTQPLDRRFFVWCSGDWLAIQIGQDNPFSDLYTLAEATFALAGRPGTGPSQTGPALARGPESAWMRLVFWRRALLSGRYSTPQDIDALDNGQALRLLTAPELATIEELPEQITTPNPATTWSETDPAYWLARERFGPGPHPGAYSDAALLRALAEPDLDTDPEAGWRLWVDAAWPFPLASLPGTSLDFLSNARLIAAPDKAWSAIARAGVGARKNIPPEDVEESFATIPSGARIQLSNFIKSPTKEHLARLLEKIDGGVGSEGFRALVPQLNTYLRRLLEDLKTAASSESPLHRLFRNVDGPNGVLWLDQDMASLLGPLLATHADVFKTEWVRDLPLGSVQCSLATAAADSLAPPGNVPQNIPELAYAPLARSAAPALERPQDLQHLIGLAGNAAVQAHLDPEAVIEKPVDVLTRVWFAGYGADPAGQPAVALLVQKLLQKQLPVAGNKTAGQIWHDAIIPTFAKDAAAIASVLGR